MSDDAVLVVRKLEVRLPNGARVVDATDLVVRPGQVVSLLGPSGAGKTTLLRAVLAPGELLSRGYTVKWDEWKVGARAAFVPQKGALFDHLDVAANIALAQAATGAKKDVATWLAAVDLPPELAARGTSVATLSGGQAQRVAIARTMAAGRAIVVLDEPSVGLDALAVKQLAKLLHAQARERRAAIVIITHDLALAAAASDLLLFFDPEARTVRPLFDAWTPGETVGEEAREKDLARLAAEMDVRLASASRARRGDAVRRSRPRVPRSNPLATLGQALLGVLRPRPFVPSLVVLGRALVEGLLRPLAFYAITGALLGFTVPYVLTNISHDLAPKGVLKLIGGNYILSLAPPVSAILFAATSGNAVNAWLGGMRLHGQVTALEGIGVDPRRYLVAPAFLGLLVSYLAAAAVFVVAMIGGGYALYRALGVDKAFDVLTSSFVDPVAAQLPNLERGLWLFGIYAFALSTLAVAKGMTPKEEARHVTAAMTGNVILSTLFVVAMELASSVVLFAAQRKP